MINVYEVTLKIVNKQTGYTSCRTRREHAYSVMDAVMQGMTNQAAELEDDDDVIIMHVGPPAELVRQAERSLEQTISKLVKEIATK